MAHMQFTQNIYSFEVINYSLIYRISSIQQARLGNYSKGIRLWILILLAKPLKNERKSKCETHYFTITIKENNNHPLP